MPVINIAIVEDDAEIMSTMKSFIDSADDMFCAGAFSSAEAIIENFKSLNADVVLMDITLPDLNGIHCVGMLKEKRPEIQFMMFTAHFDTDRIFDSLCAGATGYLLKSESPDKMLEAIRDIYKGGSPMSPEVARLVVSSFPVKKNNLQLIEMLSVRERDIVNALAKGYQYKQIAEQLFISVETVRTYVRNIYEKLQVHSRTEALNKIFPKN